MMVDRRMPTKVLNLLGVPSSQDNTIVLSDHACVWSTGMFNALRTDDRSLARSVAPHNSKRGIDSCLRGATRVLAVTSEQVGG